MYQEQGIGNRNSTWKRGWQRRVFLVSRPCRMVQAQDWVFVLTGRFGTSGVSDFQVPNLPDAPSLHTQPQHHDTIYTKNRTTLAIRTRPIASERAITTRILRRES